MVFFFFFRSSGDSVGVKPEDQKKRYDETVAKKPSNVLYLKHEVYGMFFLVFKFFSFYSSLINVNYFSDCLSSLFFRNQRVSLLLCFLSFFCLLNRKKCFTDMRSFHMQSKFFKQRDTSWLQLLNVLGKILTSALKLLPHEMYVNLFFFPGIFFDSFFFFFCRQLGIVKYFVSH